MNPDDIATETIMPEAFLDLAREMVAQKSPEAAAIAALAWALRHAPVVEGTGLEIAGHRIERITPEPDPWPTAPLIVADMGGERELFSRNVEGAYESSTFYVDSDTIEPLTNVVPVTVVPVADLDALARASRAVGSPGLPDSLQDRVIRLLEATDALGVDL